MLDDYVISVDACARVDFEALRDDAALRPKFEGYTKLFVNERSYRIFESEMGSDWASAHLSIY